MLKGAVVSAGYRAKCVDFNLVLFNFCNQNYNQFSLIQNYLSSPGIVLKKQDQEIVDNLIKFIVDTVSNVNSRYIGFSVFSDYTHKIITLLLFEFKKLNMLDRIILGGRGLTTSTNYGALPLLNINDYNLSTNFCDVLKDKELISHVITGNGENAIVDFLNANSPNHQIIKPDSVWPDYNDYNFQDYPWVDGVVSLDVTGSTGCVRDCDFCDVRKQFGKYKFLPGEDLAEQMIYFQQLYGINKFNLTDSLSNGGLKPFTAFLTRLAEFNSTAINQIEWNGQYICRDDVVTRKNIDEYYQLLKLSGAKGLTIGAESGSNHVLNAMNKKSSVEALFFELEKFREYGINCYLLTFIGHWSERHEDFIEHCKMLIKIIPYVRAGTVSAVHLGSPFILIPNTPAAQNINIIQDSFMLWAARNNRGNTYKTRIQRRLIVSELMSELGLSVSTEESAILQNIYFFANSHVDAINKFFIKHHNDTSQFDAIKDIDKTVHELLNYKDAVDINLKLKSSAFNGNPNLVVTVNDTILWQGELESGEHNLKFTVDKIKLTSYNNIFSIAMNNKNANDTDVDQNGNILADKSIVIEQLQIDDCDLIGDFNFFYNNFFYQQVNGHHGKASPGLWGNDPLCLRFDMPFVQWYSRLSNRNKSNAHTDRIHQEIQGKLTSSDYILKIKDIIKKLL